MKGRKTRGGAVLYFDTDTASIVAGPGSDHSGRPGRIHFELFKKSIEKKSRKKLTPNALLDVAFRTMAKVDKEFLDSGQMPRDHIHHNNLVALSDFLESGRQVFELGPVLADAFLSTKLNNIKLEHVRTPFRTIYITIPQGLAQVWGGKRTGYHDVDGVYITRDARGALKIMWWGGPNPKSIDPCDDAVGWLTIKPEVLSGPIPKTVEDYLDVLFSASSAYRPEALGDRPTPEEHRHLAHYADENARRAVRLAINTCLYLTSPKNPVAVDKKHKQQNDTVNRLCAKPPKTEREAKKLATKVSKFKQVYLTRLGPDIEGEGRKPQNGKAPGTWVMAHWSLYWTGKGRQIPRMVFKKPYFRGNLEDKDKGKNYDVRSER